MDEQRPKAPGLKWRTRKNGTAVPYWIADTDARLNGYPVKAVNLSFFKDDPGLLIERARRLQGEMRLWLSGHRSRSPTYDGTFGSLINRYLMDKESPYNLLRPSSQHPYDIYASKLKAHIGERRIDHCDGRDVRKWFKVWAGGVSDLRDPAAKLPAAKMALTVLKAAVSFGIVCRLTGCPAFKAILSELEFPSKKARDWAPSAADIEAVRKIAAPSRSLTYALQFETTLRQWDVIGQWIPLSDIRPSAIIFGAEKWIGPTWAQVSENLILRLTHEKTEGTSGAKGALDLKLCPMVMEELARTPQERRVGPLIINEESGRPYHYQQFKDAWKSDFRAAGLNPKLWNRDLRAGGVTEGGMAGAAIEDRAKVAGHTKPRTTAQVYDRDRLEAHRRVAAARKTFRGEPDDA